MILIIVFVAKLATIRFHYLKVPNPCMRARNDPAWKVWEKLGHDVDSEELPGMVVIEGRHRCEWLLERTRREPTILENPRLYWVRAIKR